MVLRIVSERRSASLTEIAEASGLPYPTVVRMIETLAHAGYVSSHAETRQFSVTAMALALSDGYNFSDRLDELAAPILRRLRSAIGWPSNLAVFDRDAMVIIHTNRRPNAFSLDIRPGARAPLLVTGIGRAYLAFSPKGVVDGALAGLRGSSNKWDQAAKRPERVYALLEQVREDRYALSDRQYVAEVYDDDIWAVAVPIVVDGMAKASLSALVLRHAASEEHGATQLLPPLHTAATEIAELIRSEI